MTRNVQIPLWLWIAQPAALVVITGVVSYFFAKLSLRHQAHQEASTEAKRKRAQVYVDVLVFVVDRTTAWARLVEEGTVTDVLTGPVRPHLELALFGTEKAYQAMTRWIWAHQDLEEELKGGAPTAKSLRELERARNALQDQMVAELTPPGETRLPRDESMADEKTP